MGENIRTIVISEICEVLGVKSAYIDDDKNILHDLGADSLDIIVLTMSLEDRFKISISDEDVRRALERSIGHIVDSVKTTIEETPPELLADIMSKGIHLAGGGSLLRGLDTLITKRTKISTKIIDDPLTAVVRGAGIVLENLDELKEVLADTEFLEPPR